jgi:putative ABC transport system substrate-binding protein
MRRRDFIARLGGAATWPLMAQAQQRATPTIGYIASGAPDTDREQVTAFHRGLSEAGFIEGRNLAVEYRWAEERRERLTAFAEDLVRARVGVIVAISTSAALAAKAATTSIPVVFAIGVDPVDAGLVKSLSRPGGNITGIASLLVTTSAKRLQLLHELVPAAASLGLLVDPADRVFGEEQAREMQVAARVLGVHLLIVNASDERELEAAFATLARERAGGLVVASGGWFYNHPDQLVALETRHRMCTIYGDRRYATVGGLASYGTDLPETRRQVGVYAGRILKGEKPTDLPVQQVTKMQMTINLKTAKALGLTIPETLLATADEVIQ